MKTSLYKVQYKNGLVVNLPMYIIKYLKINKGDYLLINIDELEKKFTIEPIFIKKNTPIIEANNKYIKNNNEYIRKARFQNSNNVTISISPILADILDIKKGDFLTCTFNYNNHNIIYKKPLESNT